MFVILTCLQWFSWGKPASVLVHLLAALESDVGGVHGPDLCQKKIELDLTEP